MKVKIISTICVALMLACISPGLSVAKKKGKSEFSNAKFVKLYFDTARALTQGKYSLALGYALGATREFPNSGRMNMLLGTAYKAKGQYGKAIASFQKASSHFHSQNQFYEKAQSLYNVAMCFELSKKYIEAIAAWRMYVAFVSSYPQETASAIFAKARIKSLSKAKR